MNLAYWIRHIAESTTYQVLERKKRNKCGFQWDTNLCPSGSASSWFPFEPTPNEDWGYSWFSGQLLIAVTSGCWLFQSRSSYSKVELFFQNLSQILRTPTIKQIIQMLCRNTLKCLWQPAQVAWGICETTHTLSLVQCLRWGNISYSRHQYVSWRVQFL